MQVVTTIGLDKSRCFRCLELGSSMFGRAERAPGNQRRRNGHIVRPNVDGFK